jgi:hypothetical protein
MKIRLPIVLAAAVACALTGCSSSTSPDEGIDVSAALQVDPSAGTAITDFTFDASGSTAGRRALEFRWDWDSDGTWDTGWSADAVADHRFTDGDTITVTVQADESGYRATASAEIVLDSRHGFVLDALQMDVGALVLGYHDGSLWAANHGSPRLYEVDPASGDTLRSVPSPSQWPCGICTDGVDLWVSDYLGGMKIFKVDPTAGTVLSSFPVEYSADAAGLAWDGEYLYHPSQYSQTNGGDGLIHKYRPDGTEVGTLPTPTDSDQPEGIAYDGRDLWVSVEDVDTLYVIDRDTGDVLRSLAAEGVPRDITVIGEHVWLLYGIHGLVHRTVP